MARPRRVVGTVAAALSCALLVAVAGCGFGPSGNASSTIQAGYHVLSKGKVSITVPDSWTLGKQVHIAEADATSGGAFPDYNKSSMDTSLNRKNASPFFSETLSSDSEDAYLNLWELSTAGNIYTVSVTVPVSDKATLKDVASHLTTPPVATATDAVHFEERSATTNPGHRITTASVGLVKWLLDAGSPGTAMQPFALYRSTDGGKTWKLERWTHFRGSDDFMGRTGKATIFFWNNEDGLIAESSGFSSPGHALLVYRTTDGGKTWTTKDVSVRGNPEGNNAPTIQGQPDGTLTIAGEGTTDAYSITSTDGGLTWTPELKTSLPAPDTNSGVTPFSWTSERAGYDAMD